jgi:hypothetical protein
VLSDIEQEKLFKKFRKVLDTRDSQKIDKALYHHLYQHCGFIAHYNIHGYRDTYEGRGFLDFIKHFEQCYYLGYGDHGKFNLRLKQYVVENAEVIRYEFAMKAEQKELKLLQSLAEKHGVSLQAKSEDIPKRQTEFVACSISDSGQYMFAI